MGKGAPFSLGVTWRQNQEVSRCSQGHGLLIHADSCIKRISKCQATRRWNKNSSVTSRCPQERSRRRSILQKGQTTLATSKLKLMCQGRYKTRPGTASVRGA